MFFIYFYSPSQSPPTEMPSIMTFEVDERSPKIDQELMFLVKKCTETLKKSHGRNGLSIFMQFQSHETSTYHWVAFSVSDCDIRISCEVPAEDSSRTEYYEVHITTKKLVIYVWSWETLKRTFSDANETQILSELQRFKLQLIDIFQDIMQTSQIEYITGKIAMNNYNQLVSYFNGLYTSVLFSFSPNF